MSADSSNQAKKAKAQECMSLLTQLNFKSILPPSSAVSTPSGTPSKEDENAIVLANEDAKCVKRITFYLSQLEKDNHEDAENFRIARGLPLIDSIKFMLQTAVDQGLMCDTDFDQQSKNLAERDNKLSTQAQAITADSSPPVKSSRTERKDVVTFRNDDIHNFVSLLNNAPEALAQLQLIAQATPYQAPDEPPVRPEKFPTWNDEEWQRTLAEGRSKLQGLTSFTATGPRILGVWAGTGNGKSHRLMDLDHFDPQATLRQAECQVADLTEGEGQQEAAVMKRKKIVDNTLVDVPPVDKFLYLTYNMHQNLSFDRSNPEHATLLRVVLRAIGVTNRGCAEFLKNFTMPPKLYSGSLLNLIVQHFKSVTVKHVAIGVDEIRCLLSDSDKETSETVQAVTSVLGILASLLEDSGIRCTVVVTSLTEGTFKSTSGRPIFPIHTPSITPESIDFIIENGFQNPTDTNRAMIKAAAGCHFRSAVVAMRIVEKNVEIGAHALFEQVSETIETKLSPSERKLIREYIEETIQGKSFEDSRQRFVDVSGAIPPAFTFLAYKGSTHPARMLFESSAFVSPEKQLERCGMYYDQFRALLKLPVIPAGVPLHNNNGLDHLGDSSQWRFAESMATNAPSTDPIFVVRGKDKKKVVKVSNWRPPEDRYVFPDAETHPWIDRACLVHGVSDTRCLFIYQDRINKSGFGSAVQHLNMAADSLKKSLNYPVVCVAQVIQALDTKAQDTFRHPYVLIRRDGVDAFYKPTFAAPIRYTMDRHNLSPGFSHSDDPLEEGTEEAAE